MTGTIIDARDGTPLEKVAVRVHDTKLTTLTTSDGRFQLESVPAGRRELYVSSVDYILVRRAVDVLAGAIVDITIPIAAGRDTGLGLGVPNPRSRDKGSEGAIGRNFSCAFR
ncbi:MAG TPA: carboxypeptidase regulatory-like domain-containing protein [Vicinamibacterales bacterium]|nr:carboxypeptidase regulatory-like domain-containing protein [Vicinamibacterales bacterium]